MPRGRVKFPLIIEPGGIAESSNPAALPPGKLLSSSNFLTRGGIGTVRSGFEQMGTQLAAADRVIGFGSRGSSLTESNLVVHTVTAAYNWTGSAFNAITGTWTASNPDEHVRFTTYIQSGTLHIIRINAQNAPDSWNGTGSFADVGGSPPTGVDICTVNGRVLVARAAGNVYRVQWSDFNDMATWGAASFADLSDTPDEVVASQAFGPLSAAIYKEDSVWLATAQAAAAPFQFQFVGHVPGPHSAASVMSYRGVHYWLGRDHVVYRFDGSRIEAVSNDAAETLGNNLNWANRARSHAFVLALDEPELWFVYPNASTAALDRAVCVNTTTNATTTHTFGTPITAGLRWTSQPAITWDSLTGTWDTLDQTYPTWDDMGGVARRVSVVGSDAGRVYRFNVGALDGAFAIAWEFVHGWRAIAGFDKNFYLDSVVSYWRRLASSLTVTVGVIVSSDLSDTDTETTGTFDISTASEHRVNFPNSRGKWARVRHAANSAIAGLEHRGAAILGWARGMP